MYLKSQNKANKYCNKLIVLFSFFQEFVILAFYNLKNEKKVLVNNKITSILYLRIKILYKNWFFTQFPVTAGKRVPLQQEREVCMRRAQTWSFCKKNATNSKEKWENQLKQTCQLVRKCKFKTVVIAIVIQNYCYCTTFKKKRLITAANSTIKPLITFLYCSCLVLHTNRSLGTA